MYIIVWIPLWCPNIPKHVLLISKISILSMLFETTRFIGCCRTFDSVERLWCHARPKPDPIYISTAPSSMWSCMVWANAMFFNNFICFIFWGKIYIFKVMHFQMCHVKLIAILFVEIVHFAFTKFYYIVCMVDFRFYSLTGLHLLAPSKPWPHVFCLLLIWKTLIIGILAIGTNCCFIIITCIVIMLYFSVFIFY